MLTSEAVHAVITLALLEDAPWGDVTSDLLIPEEATATAQLVAREPGRFSGGTVFTATMTAVDARIHTVVHLGEGDAFTAGQVLATVSGPARGILRGERVALNLTQRMSGIATITALYVAKTAGTSARITDTRKTTPGLRVLERHAVVCGGGHNHRFSLSDAVLAKDNHLAILTQSTGLSVTEALREVRSKLGHTTHFEVEVDRIDQIEPVLLGGVDTIMLDNFTPAMLREGVAMIAGRATIEASGGVNLGTVAEIAATGVDVISVGALTHSARALDLGLDVSIQAPAVQAPAVQAPAVQAPAVQAPAVEATAGGPA